MKRKLTVPAFLLVIVMMFSACGSGQTASNIGLEYAEDFAVEDLPEGLGTFLQRFSLYHDPGVTSYDCTFVGDVNMIDCVAGQEWIADYSTYGLDEGEFFFYSDDPEGVGASNPYYCGYILRRADDVEWICRNIFHVSDPDMASMLDKGTDEKLFYKCVLDGTDYYCAVMTGFGASDPYCEISVSAAKYDGSRYYIVYDETSPFGDLWGTYYAVMDTTDDGYWTLYSFTDEVPEEFNVSEE